MALWLHTHSTHKELVSMETRSLGYMALEYTVTTKRAVVYVINTTGGAFDLYSSHSTIVINHEASELQWP